MPAGMRRGLPASPSESKRIRPLRAASPLSSRGIATGRSASPNALGGATESLRMVIGPPPS